MNLHTYGDVYGSEHRLVQDIFETPVSIEEKIDGSQITWGVRNGELIVQSKRAPLYFDKNGICTTSMFVAAGTTILNLYNSGKLIEGLTYYGEYLSKPKHNVLAYARVPRNNIILFDVMGTEESWFTYEQKAAIAADLDLEVVPLLFQGKPQSYQLALIDKLLAKESILGGQLIEGFVIKNYDKFTPDKKYMKGKVVSTKFKEVHNKEWKKYNPTRTDVVEHLISSLRTKARWNKAIMHLTEQGILKGTPADIGPLCREIMDDTEKEETEYIKNKLFAHFKQVILRGTLRGFAEWYKEELQKRSLSDTPPPEKDEQ